MSKNMKWGIGGVVLCAGIGMLAGEAVFAKCAPGATCRSFLEQTLDAIPACVQCSVVKDGGQSGFVLSCRIRCAMRSGSGNDAGSENAGQGAYQAVRVPAYAPVPPLQVLPPTPSFWNAPFSR